MLEEVRRLGRRLAGLPRALSASLLKGEPLKFRARHVFPRAAFSTAPLLHSHPAPRAVSEGSRLRSFAVSADLSRCVVCKWDSTVTVLDMQSGEVLATLQKWGERDSATGHTSGERRLLGCGAHSRRLPVLAPPAATSMPVAVPLRGRTAIESGGATLAVTA